MKKSMSIAVVTLALVMTNGAAFAGNPFVGYWSFTLSNGSHGWLAVAEEAGKLKGDALWGAGSVRPVDSIKLVGDQLVFTRAMPVRSGPDKGKKTTETFTATRKGDELKITWVKTRPDGREFGRAELEGRRLPPMPDRPDLSKVKFGKPVTLFNGEDLKGWELVGENKVNGWIAKDGVLVNNAVQQKGKKVPYGNLKSAEEFEDFKLTLDVNVPEKSNSGIYLRGLYEIQVLDSYGKPLNSHNMGALYSRVTPSVAAEKPAGEWQKMEITLVDRHVTVVLNGKTIIDNQPALGCTGGALGSDPMKPGPLYLQGNHGAVSFRNIVLTPVVN